MKPTFTQTQLLKVFDLLRNLNKFVEMKYGNIQNLNTLIHPMMNENVLVKYEKYYSNAGQEAYEFRIASIDGAGNIEFIENKFKDAFEQAAFLSICRNLNLEDENTYNKIF